MNLSVLLVEGDHTQNLRDLFTHFGYEYTGNIEIVLGDDRKLQKISSPRKELNRDVVYKGVMKEGRWTAILDGEFVMIVDEPKCTELVQRIKGEVFGFLAGGTSGTYAFLQYTQSGKRELFVQEGEILTDSGGSLPEEDGLNKQELSETELLSMCEKKGFDVELFWTGTREVLLVELAEPREPRPQENVGKTPSPLPTHKKPWWSFFLRK